MNNEILLISVIGITAGLVIAVLAAFRGKKDPSPGILGRGGIAALLVYAVVAAPVFVRGGMTLFGLLALAAVVALAAAAMMLSRRSGTKSGGRAELLARTLVGTGLAAAMLIAAGQTISMLSLVDPRTVVVVTASVAALLVAGQGLAGSSRVGSLAVWLMILPIAISLALGFALGSPAKAATPVIVTDGTPIVQVLALALAVIAIGWGDNAIGALRAAGGWPPLAMLCGALTVIVLVLFGQLMFFGGVAVSPSLQFFTVPANIDMVPALAAVLMAVLSTLFAALVASALAGVGSLTSPKTLSASWMLVLPSAAIAVAVALAGPGLEHVVVATSLIGASLAGAQLGSGDCQRGIAAGMAVAVAASVVLAATGRLDLGIGTMIATAAVLVAAGAAARSGAETTLPAEQLAATGS
jgi:hypothetical protein